MPSPEISTGIRSPAPGYWIGTPCRAATASPFRRVVREPGERVQRVAHHIAAVPVEPFLWTWQFDAVDPRRAELQSSWVGKLLEGKITLRDLLDATQARYRDELHQPEPPSFLIYIDQGEELYARAAERGLRLRHTRRV